jgi:hypothetical protein
MATAQAENNSSRTAGPAHQSAATLQRAEIGMHFLSLPGIGRPGRLHLAVASTVWCNPLFCERGAGGSTGVSPKPGAVTACGSCYSSLW